MVRMDRMPSPLGPGLLIVAFGGWADAGEAATGAARHIRETGRYARLRRFDPDTYLDYQSARPEAKRTARGMRIVPPTLVFHQELDARADGAAERLHVLLGPEPSRQWRRFIRATLEAARAVGVTGLVVLGAVQADVPHTRPIDVQATSEDPEVRDSLKIPGSDYEGPVGLGSVLAAAAARRGVPALSLWASVPHYAAGAPSPKAASALVKAVEQYTGTRIPHEDLDAEAGVWEETLDSLTSEDEDMASYVRHLESSHDRAEPAPATGDQIAAEIETFLRRNGESRGGL